MTTEPVVPEYLHRDELEYELAVRGVPIEGLNVAALRALFRTSRDVEVNAEQFITTKGLKDTPTILSFCQDKFLQIKELVENTDSSRVSVDFPRYLHRLVHLGTRLRHLFQFRRIPPELESSALTLREQVQSLSAEINSNLQPEDHTSSVPPLAASTINLHNAEGRTESAVVFSATPHMEHLTHSPSLVVDPASQPNDRSILGNLPTTGVSTYPGSISAFPFVFAKLPNPVQQMFQGLPVTDGLDLSQLINFLRVLVRSSHILTVFQVPPVHVLQGFYGFTKGALASKTFDAIRRGDTLQAYHESILEFFIPTRAMLPLISSHYLRAQRANEPLAAYITDIKEIAAVLRQDADEAAVVRNILDGLHPRERSRLVFCDKPATYAELDNMCIYAHNISASDESQSSRSRNPPTVMTLAESSVSGNPTSQPSQKVCYRCNKVGHIRRECRVKLSASPRQPPLSQLRRD